MGYIKDVYLLLHQRIYKLRMSLLSTIQQFSKDLYERILVVCLIIQVGCVHIPSLHVFIITHILQRWSWAKWKTNLIRQGLGYFGLEVRLLLWSWHGLLNAANTQVKVLHQIELTLLHLTHELLDQPRLKVESTILYYQTALQASNLTRWIGHEFTLGCWREENLLDLFVLQAKGIRIEARLLVREAVEWLILLGLLGLGQVEVLPGLR